MSEVKKLWKNTGVVASGPINRFSPPSLAIMRRFEENPKEFEVELIKLLDNKDRFIVAYSLVALKHIQSDVIKSPPDFLTHDDRKFMKRTGSFGRSTTIAKFLRELREE